MRVLFFPTLPFPKDGYSIAVCSDLNRLQPTQDDFVIWYNMDLYQETPPYGFKINGPSRFALKRYINLLKGNLSCEFTRKDLKNYQLPENPDSIFCGDIHFYRVLRSYYPHLNIDVRFHNCYSRISQRINLLGYANPNIKFKINLRGNCRLEKEIFNDNKTRKFFISDEDRNFYVSMMGKRDDSDVWGVLPDFELVKKNRKKIYRPSKIVWFGGIQAHKSDSVKWFVKDVYTPLKVKYPYIEFHLFGQGTDSYNEPDLSIYGHGRYEGTGMPYKDEGVFINPDLTGGGVKIKLKQYFEEGVTFITNPFGYEGYPQEWADNEYCYCVQLDKWFECLDSLFSDNTKNGK